MKLNCVSKFIIIFLLFSSCQHYEKGVIKNLKSEYLINPLAIATDTPHFSWQMVSEEKDLMQLAYSIKVWSDIETMWKMEKTESNQSVGIVYNGKKIIPFTKYYWQVKVWDNKQKVYISDVAEFETGPMVTGDWQAKWIGKPSKDREKYDYKMNEAFWIWYPEGRTDTDNPKGNRYFKAGFAVENIKDVVSSSLIFTGDDTCTMWINGKLACQSKYLKILHFNVLGLMKEGQNSFEIKVNNIWGGAGLFCQLYLKYKDGKIVYFSSDKHWLSSRDKQKWVNAIEIGAFGKTEGLNWLNEYSLLSEEFLPPAYLRKDFTAVKKIESARLYATSFGFYQMFLNGEKVGKNVLTPGWTDYHKRVYYQSYDVTSMVKKGDNAIGAILADGWFAGTIGWGHKHNNYGSYPLWLLAELHIEYSNGDKVIIKTDSSWKTSFGPIAAADLLDGETYDARKELKGWSGTNYNASAWINAIQWSGSANVEPDPGPGIIVNDTLYPNIIYKVKKNTYVFDMGQNMVGDVCLKIQGNAGDTIRLRYAEMLYPDSSIYTANLRTAKVTDYYILSGNGMETFVPSFTFHGFRYVEVSGLKQAPGKEMITGLVIHSNTPRTGYFNCSDELINKIYHNAFWGQKSNYVSVPTDCPQRDERLGWMGDALVFTSTACFNMDVCPFFNKWVCDIVDAQAEDGGFSDVSPRLIATGNGAPAWGDAGILVPWTIYNFYNNIAILEKYYPAYVKWVDYIWKNNTDLLWIKNRGSNYGDWLSTNAETDKDVLSTAFFANSVNTLSKIAATIHKDEDSRKYAELFGCIKAAFNKAYVSADGKIKGNTQTAYVLALQFCLLPDSLKSRTAKYLVEDIKKRDWHHSTGFIGIGNLMQVLTDNGYPDVAYKLMENKTFPSLGYMVVNGATTIWERWDGWTTKKGFQDPGMNSFNHYSLGSPVRWLYTHVAGINPIEPAFKTFKIKPYIGGNLKFANAELETPFGKIVSHWIKDDNGGIKFNVQIPANTKAEIDVPGINVTSIEGLKTTGSDSLYTRFEAGSGKYLFEIKSK